MGGVDLLAMGELLIDMFPDRIGRRIGEVEAFHPKPGGAPANVAVAASRLGARSGFIGKVGQDHFGTHLEQVLNKEGVNTSGLRFDPEARTTMAVIAMPDEHSAEFVFYRNPGADQRITKDELAEELIRSARAFHVGSLSLTHEPARETTFYAVELARSAGCLISFDVNYRPTLWSEPGQALSQAKRMIAEVDLVKLNETEAAMLADLRSLDPSNGDQLAPAAQAIHQMGPALVVITLGADGCFFSMEAGSGFMPAFNVETIDAIGCGDAFMASLLVGLIREGDWQAMLTSEQMASVLLFANAAGALTSMHRGAMPAMPTRAQVEDFLDTIESR